MTQHPYYPKFNKEVAENTLVSILAFPQEHEQESWFDFTTFDQLVGEEKEFKETIVDPIEGEEVEVPVKVKSVTVNGMLEGSCGTTACIAGWAALHGGWTIQVRREEREGWLDTTQTVISPNGETETYGLTVDLESQGGEALGIDPTDANSLFMTMDESQAILILHHVINGGEVYGFDVWREAQKKGLIPEGTDFEEYCEENHLEYYEADEELSRELLALVEAEYAPRVEKILKEIKSK